MCWMCDHPGSTRADYLDHMRGMIAWCGWAVQGVERDGIHPPWAYTVGLTLAGQPELVVTGMPVRRAARFLNEQAEHTLHAGLPAPGEPVELIGGPVIQIAEVAEPTAHLFIAEELFGPQIRAMQVVHADNQGHWPWESEYRGVRGGQPVLGPHIFAKVTQPATFSSPVPAEPASDVSPPADEPAAQPGEPAGSGSLAQADSPATRPGQPSRPGHHRTPDRRNAATRRTSRGSGSRRASRGPRRRSARSSARPPSPPQ
jgi:hypothetical protein